MKNSQMKNWQLRISGFILILATIWYLPWLFENLNWRALWLAIPFALASVLTALMTLVTVVNHWEYSSPTVRKVRRGHEPAVLVIIPTAGEPPSMVYETARSVLDQDYPLSKLRIVISDDQHTPASEAMVMRLVKEYPGAFISYHLPPVRGEAARRGDAKAGNLNSVLDAAVQLYPDVQFVETRDSDDRVGDPSFLRQAVGQLLAQPKLAFVQTIKESVVSAGDPFGNQEPLFYRKAMLAKNAANAVFPCGSGLVWRRKALDDIGGFPTWNLVEDLQSGMEALRKGWRGLYLPIVGALGQSAPEDLPNAIKQRGTWAVDTMRLTFWGNKYGLNVRQHLHFSELGLFYLLSFAVLVFAIVPVVALAFNIYPLITSHAEYALRFWPYAAAIELMLISLAAGLPYEDLWRSRQTWFGMAPVYAKACLVSLVYGPNRKPAYRVTRKEHQRGFYLRYVWFQVALFVALLVASIYHVSTHSLLTEADLGSLFWAIVFMLLLSRPIRNAWYGVRPAVRQTRAARVLRASLVGAIVRMFRG